MSESSKPQETEDEDEQGEGSVYTKCPECGFDELKQDYRRGELVCVDCGIVIDNLYVDDGPEWSGGTFEEWQKRARTGAPMTVMLHDKGLTSVIGNDRKDVYGSSFSEEKKRQINRLKNWNRRSRRSGSAERNLSIALGEIERMASQLDIPKSIREQASMVYRRALREDLVRGRSIEAVAGAAVYVACRKQKVPRTLDEIDRISRVPKKDLARTYRYLADRLDINIEPPTPLDYVNRFCSQLDVSQEVVRETNEILNSVSNSSFTFGKAPNSITAAAIYLAGKRCGEPVTQQEISISCQTTEVTIRNRYKEIKKELENDDA